jgi:hypothetical protein
MLHWAVGPGLDAPNDHTEGAPGLDAPNDHTEGAPGPSPMGTGETPDLNLQEVAHGLAGSVPVSAPGSGSAVAPLRGAQENVFWHAKAAKSALKTRFLGGKSPV